MTDYSLDTDTKLQLYVSPHHYIEADCAQLRTLAPGPSYILFPKNWECGPMTFDWLLETIFDANTLDEEDRKRYMERIEAEKMQILYRAVPIKKLIAIRDERGETVAVPEHRLWPH